MCCLTPCTCVFSWIIVGAGALMPFGMVGGIGGVCKAGIFLDWPFVKFN